MTIREQLLLYTAVLIALTGFAFTAYACQAQDNRFKREMHEKGFCWTLVANTNVWVWRPCEPKDAR